MRFRISRPTNQTLTLDFTTAWHTIAAMLRTFGQVTLAAFLLLLALATSEFVDHAVTLGWAGIWGEAPWSRITSQIWAANVGIFTHMIAGAVITVLAPIQVTPVLRRRLPVVHRWSGRVLVALAILTALGGLTYIALNGTVGGPQMNFAFAIYGLLVILCAGQTIRHARARRWADHQDWALRMFFLAIASFLYRVHYALWIPATDAAGMREDFTGWFDQINLWVFYLPYLLGLELVLWWQGRGGCVEGDGACGAICQPDARKTIAP